MRVKQLGTLQKPKSAAAAAAGAMRLQQHLHLGPLRLHIGFISSRKSTVRRVRWVRRRAGGRRAALAAPWRGWNVQAAAPLLPLWKVEEKLLKQESLLLPPSVTDAFSKSNVARLRCSNAPLQNGGPTRLRAKVWII